MPAPLTGQVALSGTASRVDPTDSAASCKGFVLKSPATNAASVFIGNSTVTASTGHQMDPGDEIAYSRIAQNAQPPYETRPSEFYAIGAGGDLLTWLASP